MNREPLFIMLCGIPGAGKSYVASEIAKLLMVEVHSSDKIREEIYGNAECQDHNDKVFRILHKRVRENLINGQSVIYDATNIKSKRRAAFLREISRIPCKKICFAIVSPYAKCLELNIARECHVPEEVMRRMYTNWETPAMHEGWDAIHIFYPTKDARNFGSPETVPDDYMDFNQENHHHDLSLGKHLAETVVHLQTDDVVVRNAAYLHDIGKPFCKDFRGTHEAHYYNHECVSAYDALFYDMDNVAETSVLIGLHMKPYMWERDKENGEKIRQKYRKIWGEELYDKVMLLHEADKAAH